MTTVPSNIDFAAEVKYDRLNLLWKLTAAVSAFVFVFCFVLFSAEGVRNKLWIYAPLVILVCSLMTPYLLPRNFSLAAWNFTLGGMLAVVIGMSDGGIYL